MLETLRQDLKYAVRGLRAKPAFTAAVVATLALGVGANAAMFGIVDGILFRPPAYLIDPNSVHRVYTAQTMRGKEFVGGVSEYARYLDFARWTSSFSRTAGVREAQLAVGTGEAAREKWVGTVSASFFGFFDAPPVIGRYFTAADDGLPSGEPVTVLSYATWQAQYASRTDALGSKVQIGANIYTVIGVAPRGFVGLWPGSAPAYWIPITSYAAGVAKGATWLRGKNWWATYSWGWMDMIARRKPGVTVQTANADLANAMQLSYRAEMIEKHAPPATVTRPRALIASILPERGPTESSTAKVATWVGGMAVIVLLIACANIANLLLARALRRRREIALRLALGVSRARLSAQLFTESFLLALIGGVAGLVVGQWGGAALRAALAPSSGALRVPSWMSSTSLPPGPTFTDPRTLVFSAMAALAVGLLTGIAPLVQASRADLTSDLKAGAREGVHHHSRARVGLLVMQAALSVLLLVSAGLFVRSLHNVQSVRLGFDADPVLLVTPINRGNVLDSVGLVQMRQRIKEAAKTIPGVENVSLQNTIPFWSFSSTNLYVQGIDTVSRLGRFYFDAVSPEYFATVGTRIIRGRGLSDQDRAGGLRVMVVSDAMGKRLWPDKDPVGQCIRVDADTMPCTYVVGIAENITQRSYGDDDPGYYYYMPATQYYTYYGGLFVRVRGDASKYDETVRRRLQSEMPGATYVTTTPMSDIVGGQQQAWKLGATMFAVFGLLALALAAIGLYSVISYNVAQRTHEMGVRVALGAQVGDVVWMVVREGVLLGVVGVAIGTAAALLAGKWIKPLLFNESAFDPAVFSFVVLVLLAVSVAASWIPARRASAVNPQIALRTD